MKAFILEGEWSPKPGLIMSPRELADHRSMHSGLTWKNLSCSIKEVPVPQIKDNEVLIKVGACGVCGSDIHSIAMKEDGYMQFGCHTRLPVILGHEFSGEIVEIGKNIKNYKVGDLIAVEQIHWCGECRNCRAGWVNNCESREDIGLSADGGFCEYAVVPEKYCCKINDIAEKLGDKLAALEAGALAEPTSVAYHSIMINADGFKPGSNISIHGAGPIGLSAVALCRAAGASKIFVYDTVPERLEIAKRIGADECFNPMDYINNDVKSSDIIMDITDGVGCHVCVEAAGNPGATYLEISNIMAAHSKLVQIGLPGKIPQIDLTPFIFNSTSIYCCSGSAGFDIFPNVLRMMASGLIDMRQIISGRYDLQHTYEAIKDAGAGSPGKVLVSQYY